MVTAVEIIERLHPPARSLSMRDKLEISLAVYDADRSRALRASSGLRTKAVCDSEARAQVVRGLLRDAA